MARWPRCPRTPNPATRSLLYTPVRLCSLWSPLARLIREATPSQKEERGTCGHKQHGTFCGNYDRSLPLAWCQEASPFGVLRRGQEMLRLAHCCTGGIV